jgi:hypothetical protein
MRGTSGSFCLSRQVSEVMELVLERCVGCRHQLKEEDEKPQHHRVTEIEPRVTQVTDYRCHMLLCQWCV